MALFENSRNCPGQTSGQSSPVLPPEVEKSGLQVLRLSSPHCWSRAPDSAPFGIWLYRTLRHTLCNHGVRQTDHCGHVRRMKFSDMSDVFCNQPLYLLSKQCLLQTHPDPFIPKTWTDDEGETAWAIIVQVCSISSKRGDIFRSYAQIHIQNTLQQYFNTGTKWPGRYVENLNIKSCFSRTENHGANGSDTDSPWC